MEENYNTSYEAAFLTPQKRMLPFLCHSQMKREEVHGREEALGQASIHNNYFTLEQIEDNKKNTFL